MLHGNLVVASYPCLLVQFNNITQRMTYDDFLSLEWTVRSINARAYFEQYPNEERIHLCTSSSDLFFSFLPDELVALKAMLAQAVARLHWYVALNKSLN